MASKARRRRRGFGCRLTSLIVGLIVAVVWFLYPGAQLFFRHGFLKAKEAVYSWSRSLEHPTTGGNQAKSAQNKSKGEISIRWSQKRKNKLQPEGEYSALAQKETRELSPKPVVGLSKALLRGVLQVQVDESRTLTSDGMYQTERKAGYGFVVDQEDYSTFIVTAAHLLRGAQPKVSAAPVGPFLSAEIVIIDHAADLALLRVSRRSLPNASALVLESSPHFAPTGHCWLVNPGNGISFVDGRGLGQPAQAKRLIAKTFGSKRAATDWFVVAQPSHKGLSGSPVLSDSGRVVGVLIGGLEPQEGPDMSIVMGPETLASFLDIAHGGAH